MYEWLYMNIYYVLQTNENINDEFVLPHQETCCLPIMDTTVKLSLTQKNGFNFQNLYENCLLNKC